VPSPEKRELKRNGEVYGHRWVVRVRDPLRDKFTSATYATRPEAERFCRDVEDRGVAWALSEYRREKLGQDEPTLDEWAETHFDSLTEASGATVRRYRRIYADCWHEPLGHMRLSEIERTHVAKALNKVTGSDKTVKNKWAVLTDMLKKAAQDGKIPRSPTLKVKPPRRTEHQTEEHRYLTHEEFRAVLNATPDFWKPLVTMLAGTGMRWGELAALTVGDVDLEQRVARITKAMKQDAENPSRSIVGPPKSKAGRRSVSLPQSVVEAIRPLTESRSGKERLFLAPRGGELRHRTFYVRVWCTEIIPNSGIREPRPRLHDLRHSHVAWLIAAGASLPVIQKRLGHEKITTTIDTYGHLLPELQRAAAEAADLVFATPPTAPELD
jgi:integrase